MIHAQTPAWLLVGRLKQTGPLHFFDPKELLPGPEEHGVNTDTQLHPARSAAVAQAGHWMAVE